MPLCILCPSTATRQHEETCWHACHFPSPTCCSMVIHIPGYSYTKSIIVDSMATPVCHLQVQPHDSDGSPFPHLVSQHWYLEAQVCLFIPYRVPASQCGNVGTPVCILLYPRTTMCGLGMSMNSPAMSLSYHMTELTCSYVCHVSAPFCATQAHVNTCAMS